MVRILVKNLIGAYGDAAYIEATGLSTDTKPTENVLTGSTFLEIDTSKVYFYDEDSGNWLEAGGTNA